MRILAVERELAFVDTRKMHDLLREESAAVWALIKQEVIRNIWFTRADKRAVILLECADVEAAKRHLALLPLVRERCIDFDLEALSAYDGFERLFDCDKCQPR